MSLRRFIDRIALCIVIVLASTYVQAMAHVDHSTSVMVEAQLPPCHHAADDDQSKERGGHHNGCCSNFACAVGIIAECSVTVLPRPIAIHEIDYGSVSRSISRQPPNPPPKFI